MKIDRDKKIEIFAWISLLFIIGLITYFISFRIYQNKIITKNTVSYKTFIEMVNKNEVKEVYINLDKANFSFTTKDGQIKYTSNPKTNDFKKFLLEKDIEVKEIENTDKYYIYDIIKTVLYIFIFFKLIKYLMSFNKNALFTFNNLKTVNKNNKAIKLDNVILNNETKKEIAVFVDFLKNPKKYKKAGAKLPKGIIFYGPPGTGKTLTARAIAGEANVPFFYTSGSDFVELFAGFGAKKVRELFEKAKENAPCIVFIDEIDAVGTKRGSTLNSEKDQTINALLNELDGFDQNEGIIVITATNRLEDLDEALIRPGRFDKHIAIPLPDYEERLAMFKLHLKDKKISNDINLENWAKITIGFSGAGISTLINEAVINSVIKGRKEITEEDLQDAFYKFVLKGHKKEIKKDNDDIKIIAWHEAGHALVTKLLTDYSIPKVSIIPNTNGAGGITFITPNKLGLNTKEELINNVKIMYAGRIAEKLLTNDDNKVTTGAQNDIVKATEILYNIVTNFGMSEQFGLINTQVLKLNNEIIMKEIINLSKKIEAETYELLLNNKDKLEKIANLLIEKENITEKEINNILNPSVI